jgi:hypothetical protein
MTDEEHARLRQAIEDVVDGYVVAGPSRRWPWWMSRRVPRWLRRVLLWLMPR